jgi:hypothetical protein
MSYKNPPIETRFPVNRPYAPHAGHKGPYLAVILKKLLKGRRKIKDPEVKELLKKLKLPETIAVSIVLRRILNACEGDDLAIERIFDRIDGKVADVIRETKDDSALMNDEIELIPSDGNGKVNRIKQFLKKQE